MNITVWEGRHEEGIAYQTWHWHFFSLISTLGKQNLNHLLLSMWLVALHGSAVEFVDLSFGHVKNIAMIMQRWVLGLDLNRRH